MKANAEGENAAVYDRAQAELMANEEDAASESEGLLIDESIEQINLFGERQSEAEHQGASPVDGLDRQDSLVFRVSSEVITTPTPALIDITRN
jgi:hypothetical protein